MATECGSDLPQAREPVTADLRRYATKRISIYLLRERLSFSTHFKKYKFLYRYIFFRYTCNDTVKRRRNLTKTTNKPNQITYIIMLAILAQTIGQGSPNSPPINLFPY